MGKSPFTSAFTIPNSQSQVPTDTSVQIVPQWGTADVEIKNTAGGSQKVPSS